MTTDIRAESVALLAEALHTANGSGCLHEDGYGGTGWVQCDKDASWTIECSPALARRLAFATAWEMAEAECKRLEWRGPMVNRGFGDAVLWVAMAYPEGLDDEEEGCTAAGPTPTDALLALAAKLREATR